MTFSHRKKQGGFSLIETIMAMVFFSFLLLGFMQLKTKWDQGAAAKRYADHVELLVTQLQKYQHERVTIAHQDPATKAVWPQTLNNLMDNNQYWPSCSVTDEQQHRCTRPDNVPWTTRKISYSVTNQNPTQVLLTLPTAPKMWASALKKIPFAVEQANGDIIIRVGDPLISQLYKDWLRKDGSTTLTADWDVGNKAILNAKAVSVRTTDGKQRNLGVGTVVEKRIQEGDRINYWDWSCPEGLKKTVGLEIVSKIPPAGTEYIGMSSENSWVDAYSDHFIAHMTYNAKIKSTGKWEKRTTGYMTVRLNCNY
ncbi:type IV pilus modification PilV family protein [Photobacterium angustum]|uniref:type IV pilus modification PilV family protein n=1 Tax=Photobacterium angustum TaxID=661 RepID=UPI003D1382CF